MKPLPNPRLSGLSVHVPEVGKAVRFNLKNIKLLLILTLSLVIGKGKNILSI